MRFLSLIFLSFFVSGIMSCGSKEKEIVAEEKKEVTTKAETDVVTLSAEQLKKIDLQLGTIEVKNLTSYIQINGTLAVPNQNKAFVTSLSRGTIRSLNIRPGQYVSKGQIIATIVNPDLIQIQQQLSQLNSQVSLSELELKRQKELVEGNAAPLKRLQQVQTELATLQTQRSGLQNQLSSLGASRSISPSVAVRAPISGTISNVTSQIGSNVDVSTPIAEIVNNTRLIANLFVYEKDLPQLKNNQKIIFSLTNNPGTEYNAQIYTIGTAFANESKTIPVQAKVLSDKTGLIEGMNIVAKINLDTDSLPAVPNDAIVNYQGKDYVFIEADYAGSENKPVAKTDSTHNDVSFKRIEIKKGTSSDGFTEIMPVKQIPQGTKVVIKGSFYLMGKMTNAGEEE